jgi:medium-chain acyl-[acyl-carrier-protein] hydrolase
MPDNAHPNRWLKASQPRPAARMRLFCFPYAGGGASVFRTWAADLPTDVEVCPVQLPGREDRIREQPFTDASALVQALIPSLRPMLDRPFALFGHSMGALIAYELARQLTRQQMAMPTHLFVSGRRAPTLPEPDESLHALPTDDLFLSALQSRYNNIPAIVLQDAELREIFAPLLRADMTLVERYPIGAATPLPCPIIAFGGISDGRATRADLLAWQGLTQGSFDIHLMPGGHFYLNEDRQPLLARLGNYLAAIQPS